MLILNAHLAINGREDYDCHMETIRPLTEIDPRDLPVVERLFGQRLEAAEGAVLVLRTPDPAPVENGAESDELPAWCNVLEGMSDEDRDEFRAILNTPVRLTQSR
jgi:hypothetical protein